jgi:hypothetical protein
VVVVVVLPLPLPPPNPRGCSLASYDVDANDDPRALVVVVVEDAVATNWSRRYWEDDGIPTKKKQRKGATTAKKMSIDSIFPHAFC